MQFYYRSKIIIKWRLVLYRKILLKLVDAFMIGLDELVERNG